MDATAVFRDFIKNCDAYHEALYIARMNSRGKLWVVGDFVFRGIAHRLYGTSPNFADIDFAAEHLTSNIVVPCGWEKKLNAFGNPKLVKGACAIDLFSLQDLAIPMRGSGGVTIKTYLAGVTLNIQSIAYDIQEWRVIGEIGLTALRDRVVAVNNPEIHEIYFAHKGYTLKDYVLKKAEGLNFRIILPDV